MQKQADLYSMPGQIITITVLVQYSASDLLWTGYAVQYQFLYGGSEIWK